jgi:Transglycosylase SLT domain
VGIKPLFSNEYHQKLLSIETHCRHIHPVNPSASLTTAVVKERGGETSRPRIRGLSENVRIITEMKMKLLAGLSAALIATAVFVSVTQAENCHDYGTCAPQHHVKKQRHASLHHVSKRKHVRVAYAGRLSGKRLHSRDAFAADAGLPRGRGHVVAMIKSMAPRYGVPTWFALRIAKVESGFNPRARGAAGEYGVFQLKCATARGIGFRGNCGALLNASTNIQYGLKYLSMAVHSSHGNLKLAASKHNGGLGRKSMVRGYVSRVF